MKKHILASALALAFAPCLPAHALDAAALRNCASLTLNEERLACYDKLAEQVATPASAPAETVQEQQAAAPHQGDDSDDDDSYSLSRYFELDQKDKRGTFRFRSHEHTYLLLGQYNRSPNEAPYREAQARDRQHLDHTELKFQISFKLKMIENILNTPADLWFGYTQKSFWQAYNTYHSSPFRESNYAPEAMLVMPLDYSLLGFKGRMLNVGLLHESNGQGSSLSRSWNRIYVQTGLERDNWTILARGWYRVLEERNADDNRNITDYLGHGDLRVTYRWNGHETYGLLRHNFRTGRGATELGYAFPISGRAKGFVRLFSGYGESLIDYDNYQNLFGFGVMMAY